MMKSKMKCLYVLVFFYWPTVAMANLSDRAEDLSGEARSILGEVIFWFQIIGIVTAFVALVSWIKKKKSNRELDWEMYGIILGVALFLGVSLLSDVASSVSGEDIRINVDKSSSSGF